jgi:hypothetical protein
MRIRTIKPEFWQNETIATLPEFTRLLAIALLNYADDHGYFMANHKLIAGNLFPFEEDSKKIPRSIQELSCVDYLELGIDSKGRQVARVVNFDKHQRVDKPKPSIIKEDFIIQEASKNRPRRIQDASKEEGKGIGKEMEKGMEQGKESSCPISSDDSEILQFIWKSVPPKSRERSSKKELSEQWGKIKAKDKPSKQTLELALEAWNACAKWKDGFCEGVHLWVQKQQWENLPEPAVTGYQSKHQGECQEDNLTIPF